MIRRPPKRRGVLLLIVLSLLVLFVLIGLTFIVAAGQFKGNASSAARADLTGMPARKLADTSLLQLLRGTDNPYSTVKGHSLLEDLYGRDYFVGRTTSGATDWASKNQFQEIRFEFARVGEEFQSAAAREGRNPEDVIGDDYFGGCVLTFITGNAEGKSVRIVSFQRRPDNRIRFEGMVPGVQPNDLFIVNGRPFNGTGAGFSAPPFVPETAATWRLNNAIEFNGKQFPVALLPNYSAYEPRNSLFQTTIGQTKSLAEIALGGLDESWDAVDYQNVFLAKVPPRARANVSSEIQTDSEFIRNTGGIIPSFHRPYLLTHLGANPAYRDAEILNDREFRRTVLFRPDVMDHPSFSGSNPNYHPFNGPWDVDNDGDGLADSIWVDFGHDPVAGPDGRLYKPLVAPLIIDLDGKLNLNAAGSLDHLNTGNINANQNAINASREIIVPPHGSGLGYGPADINLITLNITPDDGNREKLLRSRYQGMYQGVRETIANAVPGAGPNIDDDVLLADQGTPGNAPQLNAYFRADQNTLLPGEQTSLFTGYGSPPDFRAKSVPFLDHTGNMLWAGAGNVNDELDDPYETNLLRRTPRDNLYDLSDLEILLRFDDNRTPSRLRDYNFFSYEGIDSALRRVFTTHSYHIPAVPSLNAGRWRHGFDVDGNGRPDGEGLRRGIRDMFVGKMKRTLMAANPEADPQQVEDHIWNLMATVPNLKNLVPPELARGEKLDLNRGLQSNLPGHTPQQHLELLRRKGEFARHIFHLLMLLAEEDFELPAVDVSGAAERRELHVRRLAQWAINVVDFGDADSVMTPFEYDVNPFNMDFVNYDNPFENPTGSEDRRLIWGCEHPELLLTETLAFHDRRVKDMQVGGPRKQNGQVRDDDLDQPLPPQGSLFVELYCARGGPPRLPAFPRTVSTRGPEDLYNTKLQANSTQYQPTLDLGKMAGPSPVWRLAIGQRQSLGSSAAEDSPLSRRNNNPSETSFEPVDMDLLPSPTTSQIRLNRFIWFSTVAPPNPRQLPHTYYNRGNNPGDPVVVAPGSFVVVGPRPVTHVGVTKTHMEDGSASAQKIDLNQLALTNLAVTNTRGEPLRRRPPWGQAGTSINSYPLTALVPTIIAQTTNGVGVSISEPTDVPLQYYPDPDDPDAAYPYDTPLDNRPPDANNADEPAEEQSPLWHEKGADTRQNLQLTGTRLNYRTIFLQRLANPNLPWNSDLNPYITVDWMPIDLTVFNSLDEAPNQPQEPVDEPFDPQDDPDEPIPGDEGGNDRLFNLASREKAGEALNIWSARSEPGPGEAMPAAGFTRSALTRSANTNMPHTLGWLNKALFDGVQVSGPEHYYMWGPYSESPSAFLNPNETPVYWVTYPTLVWNNRPYISEYELMLVPACSQARLTQEFTASRETAMINSPVVGSDAQKQDIYLGAFGHLLNFFHSTQGTMAESAPGTPSALAGNYYRLFDFVRVPSRFKGTETWYNASQMDPNHPFASDRNLSKFREPGRVNLNTAYDFSIRNALGIGDRIVEFEQHMAGGVPASADDNTPRVPTGQYPAEYPNPLRAAVSADLMPPIPGPGLDPLAVDATLLRTSINIPGQPLLAKYRDPKLTGGGFGPTYQNRKNNAYFRYRDIQKLANLVTSQSNVYAVWLTIGFFEIEPNYAADDTAFENPYYIDDAHPDGYRFGAEVGSDLGDVKRHRGFYIIDRSIPVAFEPGVNHNVDKAVLVRRYLD